MNEHEKKPSWRARIIFGILLIPLAYGLYKGLIWFLLQAFKRNGIPIP